MSAGTSEYNRREPADPGKPAAPAGRRYPDCVPTLVEPVSGVRLRAHEDSDLPAIVEFARDPESQRWTTVPVPPGGYSLADAREFALDIIPAGWLSGTSLSWTIEAEIEGRRRYCGSIDLRMQGDGTAEVGFGLHPAARGRSIMSSALRLVRDYALDVCHLEAVRWRAHVGNWGSRRVAASAGFRHDGTVRRLLTHRGRLVDAWVATITAEDSRAPRPWLDPPVLPGPRIVLRPFRDDDAPRVAEACADPRTQHWLVSLPQPYTEEHARHYIESTRELAAEGAALNWCVADPATDGCLGAISLDGFGGYSRRTEMGYWAHPHGRSSGLITEAVKTVTEYVENDAVSDSVTIRCASGNIASRHVAESAGYRQIGVLPRSEPLGDASVSDLVVYSRP